jgi:hypothetical protein
VAYSRKLPPEVDYADADPLTAADLSIDTRGRLLERAELRARRVMMSDRHAAEDLFWIAAELALVLPAAHPNVAARWRDEVHHWIASARHAVDQLCRLEAMILAFDGDTAAWLRRQLATLTPRGEGRP